MIGAARPSKQIKAYPAAANYAVTASPVAGAALRQAAITAIADGTERITKKNARSHPARPLRRRTQLPPHPPSGQNGMMRT
ncbi:hypothetical protein ABZT51_45025 [Streptomyces sp. NPDC005373]|uniref:hypothetical protein n=1 Tax=unclassified Streptomyces TaxID=2593676 RepID=UPI00225B008A|nr:hypothetical protein [Streptomyces sp. NBC_00120]MCX5321274.1 hypothetical protein [Streptomyces sp. NBC_00120]